MSEEDVKNMESLLLGKNIQDSSHSLSKPTKPCKACTDFKRWTKRLTNQPQDETRDMHAASQATTELVRNNDEVSVIQCPLDREELGRSTWDFIHTMAAYYPEKPSTKQKSDMKQFISLFSKFYPCDYCGTHLRKRLETDSPNTENNLSLSKWFCDVHNEVNKRLGKPNFDCSKVLERWKDGWNDGSCD